jgi:hypothetical protein
VQHAIGGIEDGLLVLDQKRLESSAITFQALPNQLGIVRLIHNYGRTGKKLVKAGKKAGPVKRRATDRRRPPSGPRDSVVVA